jgi:hypothetical protein
MKKIGLLIVAICSIAVAYATDTTMVMAKTKIVIKGNKVSTIKQLNYANKELGKSYTYTSINTDSIIFTQVQYTNGEGVDFICIQTIKPSTTKGLITDVSLQKFAEVSEIKTSPKNIWQVSIAFKQQNGNYVDVGTMVEYRLGNNENYTTKKVIKDSYTGTNRILPFATKLAAEEFVAAVKKILKFR